MTDDSTYQGSDELVESGDLYGSDPYDEDRLSFSALVSRARAKARDGERLTSQERWAIRCAEKRVPRVGPTPAVLARLRRAIELQLNEGLTLVEAAERMGCKYTTLKRHCARYNAHYARLLREVQDEIMKSGAMVRGVTAATMVKMAQRAALKVPKVWEEAVEATKTEWARGESGEFEPAAEAPDWKTRLEATKQIRDTFGLNRDNEALNPTKVTQLDEATKNLIADTLNLLRGRTLEFKPPPPPPIATDAEIVTDEKPNT